MASKSAFSSSLSVTVGLTMHARCNNASSLHFKNRQLRRFLRPGLSRLRFPPACAYAPHVLANGYLIIIKYPHRASESPAHEENPERREPDMKSPSPEYIRIHSSHSATPDRPRSPQLMEKPQAPECTLKGSLKFVILFFSLSSAR